MEKEQECPFSGRTKASSSNRDWWPNQLDLKILQQGHPRADPMGADFNYEVLASVSETAP